LQQATAPAVCAADTRPGIYRRRRPERTVLHRLVREHLETYIARAEETDPLGHGVPCFVEARFRAYLRCGILAHGFARARCSGCGHDFLVAFSCKGRGICPSCNARRMAATAAHLTDHVIPAVPVRQWVLSVPKRLRWFLARDPEVAGAVLHILLRALRHTLRDGSPGAESDTRFGAVSFLHRFGSSLNPHFHYHLCVLDGVYEALEEREGKGPPSGSVRFHEATALTRADVEALRETVRRRVLRWFVRQELLEKHVADEMLAWDHAGGFSLDASIRIEAHDRAGLERLLRYCARPPFALNRLEWQGSGQGQQDVVLYRLPRPTPDGRTVLRLSPLEFLDRLAALVPPPRVHRHRYHGVLAPSSPLRARVTASAGAATDRPFPQTTPPRPVSTLSPRTAPAGSRRVSSRWAALLARIYHAFPLLCPGCGEPMRLIAFLTDPFSIRDVLCHLREPSRPPPVHPARGPPELELGFAQASDEGMDQTPAIDPTVPEPIPTYEMDQTRSW
jgi:hypothetical protein